MIESDSKTIESDSKVIENDSKVTRGDQRLGVQGATSSQLPQTMRGMVYSHPSGKSFSEFKKRNPEKDLKTLSKYCRIPVSSEARRLCSCPSIICRERLRYAREERGSFAIAPEPFEFETQTKATISNSTKTEVAALLNDAK
jgi:hypothetical protein